MPVYKDEKTGSWYVKLYYTDYTGTKRQKMKRGFSLQREAKEWERSFMERQQAQPTMLFSALTDLYMEDTGKRLKASTCIVKKSLIDQHIMPYFRNKPINEISPADIRKWQNEIMEKKSKKKDAKFTPTYLHGINVAMSAIMEYAVRYYNLGRNPCRAAGTIGTDKAGRMAFWTKQEFDTFISAVDPSSPFYTAFLVLYYTGMRIGELMALTAADVDLKDNTITINKTFHRISRQAVITPPKTVKANRTILIPGFLSDVLRAYEKRIYDVQPDTRLFQMDKSSYNDQLNKGAEAAGVKRIRLHDLRHSHASLLIEMNFSPLLIAERLGHENIETTLSTYSHLYPNKQQEVTEKLSELCSENRY